MHQQIEYYHKPDLTYAGRMEQILGKFIDGFEITHGPVLDWGCSYGLSTRELALLLGGNIPLVGLEVSLGRLTLADPKFRSMFNINPDETKKLLNADLPIQFVCGDGYFPPFKSSTFEAIFMLNNLTELLLKYALRPDEVEGILERNMRILKDGGQLIIGSSGAGDLLIKIRKNNRAGHIVQQLQTETAAARQERSEANRMYEGLVIDQITTAIEKLNNKQKQ
jgi:SAM-dependent methyltransferase